MWTGKGGVKWYGESGMDCSQYTLPGPPPTNETYKGKDWYVKPPLADVTVRELPIAIQDMSFYDDGVQTRQFYPVSIICLGKSFCSLPTLAVISFVSLTTFSSCILVFLSECLQANHDYFLDEDGILEGDRLVMYPSTPPCYKYACSTLFILYTRCFGH